MKQRFTSVDVRAMVRSIRPRLLGAKVANVYDINNKLYILKFTSATASTDKDETTENKWFLILEAGVRFNLTEYERGSAGLPSAWTMKLRKLLRGKRLGDIRQVGSDRVIIMEFGAGEKAVIIALEMYAKGNIVVMDSSYKVTMLLRRYAYSEEEKVEVGLPYPMALAAKKGEEDVDGSSGDISDNDIIKELDGKSNVKAMSSTLLKFVPFASPQMATLAVKSSMEDGEVDPTKILRRSIEWCHSALSEVSTTKTVSGYGLKEDGKEAKIVDYAPLSRLLKGGGLDDGLIAEYPSFSECVDDYYTRLMRAQLESQLVQKETQMKSKVENIKADQNRRMGELEKEQQSLWDQAVALEANTGIADAAIQMVNALLGAKMRWDDLAVAIKQQQRAGHPLATHIRQLALDNNRISIVLEKPGAVDNDDEDTTVEVWLDLSQSAQSNVALLHEERKAMKEKMSKTEDQMAKAVKIAEKRLKGKTARNEGGAAALGGAEKQLLAKRRKKFWFQKFFWFISSDRLLVLAGRDAQQNELLWRRYLAPSDIYVHADLAGAATVIIKMPKGGIEPPQRTLAEAGQYSLCRSRAWDNKIVTSAWWVWAKQVSKTAPTGEFLSTGSFMIRGKKNFLPPSGRLEMGLGVMWTVTDDSAEKYRAQRLQREKQLEEDREKERPVDNRDYDEDEGPGVVENFDFNPKGNDDKNTDNKSGRKEGLQAGNKGAMSRQQRKQAKKAASGKEGSEEEAGSEGRATPQEKGQKSKPLTRHQRKKLEKIKEKYGDQDEEEREIRMKLIGSKEVKVLEKKEKEAKDESVETKEDESADKANEITTGKNVCFKCGEEGHLASACPNVGKGEDEQQDEDSEDEDEGEEEKVTSGGGIAHTLDRLQAWPDWKEDEVLGAMMVCAPYQAMTHIPIKVKFTPGQMKRGKAAQLGIKLLQGQLEGELRSARAAASKASTDEDGEASANAATITRHALDLLRLVPIEEASDAIGVSNVKLAASGVQRLQQKSKKEKKQLAKQREKEALLAMDAQ